jgi:putrescine aminotransferase
MTETMVDDRERVYAALGHYWSPVGATAMAAMGRPIEGHSSDSQVFSESGAAALDFAGSFGVFLVGHGNPRVRAAVLDALFEAPSLPPGTVSPATAELCVLLTEILPAGLDRFVLGCSGSDVVEAALRAVHLARPDRRRVVVAEGGFHGKTLAALSLLGQPGQRVPFEPLGREVVEVPYGDSGALRTVLADRSVAAVFLEPVLGGAHLTVPRSGYLADVAEACAATGTLFVADEIQTGFGRTGRMFAFEHDGVVPDIVLLSKAMTGGFVPVGACAFGASVLADAARHPHWDPALLGSSTCGSVLAVTAACAAIREVRERDLPGRAAALGPHLSEGLAEAVRRHPTHVVDAPGIGLMTGIRSRNPGVETLLAMGMGARGIHVGHSLNEQIAQPVTRFYPPLTVTAQEIDQVLVAVEEVLTELDARTPDDTEALTEQIRRQFGLAPRY